MNALASAATPRPALPAGPAATGTGADQEFSFSQADFERVRGRFEHAATLLAEADALAKPVRLDVLQGSPADRFYERHGFRKIKEDEIERTYERPVPKTTR